MSNHYDSYNPSEMIGPPLNVRGSQIIHENVQAVTVHVIGHLNVSKNVTTSNLKVSGDCRIAGNCNAGQVNNLGSLRVQHIKADKVVSAGYLSVAQEAVTGAFYAEGAVKIQSLTANADIEIRLGNKSTIEIMRTRSNIIVKPSSKLINTVMQPFRKLTSESIEGQNITLYRTRAKLVCGEEIVVGPGCSIDEIRYSKSLTVHPKSKVGKTVYSD